ncbi:hypothetical protein LEN26_010405 [Aphanomyces euteiches]|nr:hypothetical protein AeMF1_009977 [Aphanomyces euteiches]KAH9122070.1 hypothetical protein LEN26_010405 [Aphanomyces euteiches]KAH9181680.1 hypothetical protein AeNC1_016344 [Aphanomyces euteiches]
MSPSSTPPRDTVATTPTSGQLSPRDKIDAVSSAVAPFLASLFEILTKEDVSVIGWCDDGKSFGVYNYEAMEQHILPTYFRHNKYASFQRQLNYFGFRKLHKAKDTDHHSVYCQPFFVRDDPSRMLLIKRKTHRIKSTTPRRSILGTPINSDGYNYHHYCGMDSPVYTRANTADPCMYYNPTSATYTPSMGYESSQHELSPDAYEPLPFNPHGATNVFLVAPPSHDTTTSADLTYNPFIPVRNDYPHYSVHHQVDGHASPSSDHPIPYETTSRDSMKLSPDDLMFLYDQALCI